MSLIGGSVELALPNNRPAHVVLVDANGLPVYSSPGGGTMGSTTTIATFGAATVSTLLQASNGNRKALHLVNTSNRTLFMAYAGTVTPALYTEAIPAGNSYTIRDYTGAVAGIWETGSPLSGGCKVTEVV